MQKSSTRFSQAYQKLNTEQKKAVDIIDGPVMVIAGPGTGKTQILATRIANILRLTDTSPSSILALTFTQSGADAMKKRLISLIGETAYLINIQTFHGFCTEVIATHPEFFSLAQDAVALSDLERFQILEQIFLTLPLALIKPINAPLLYLKTAMSHIQSLKREGITPQRFHLLLENEEHELDTAQELKKSEKEKRQKNLSKNKELLLVFQRYEQELETRGRFDFEDMITLTIQAFEQHEDLLLEYQEKLQYFLVDEYQDTNSAQNAILKLLTSYWGEEANVFVVGDPNQSIYRFQGAALENTFEFLHMYPSATVVTLRQNYRSTQLILDASKAVIDHQDHQQSLGIQLEQDLVSQSTQSFPIHLYEASSDTLESVFIATEIKKLISSGVKAQDIAVIYRNNSESFAFADALSRFGIQYDIEGGSDVLRHPTITQLLLFFSVLRDIRTAVEDLNFFTVLNYRWVGLDPVVILKLTRRSSENKQSLFSLILDEKSLNEYHNTLSATEQEALSKIVVFTRQCVVWSGLDAQLVFTQWFERIIKESGLVDYLLAQPDAVEQLNLVNTLYSHIKQFSQEQRDFHLSEFLDLIQVMLDHSLHMPEQDLNLKENAVRLTTAHKSKGQEWQIVFVTGLVDKNWGNATKRELIKLPEGILQFSAISKEDQLDDDRRLFYVALTRAKHQLYLSYYKTKHTQSSRELAASVYLHTLPVSLMQSEVDFEQRQDLAQLLSMLVTSPPESSAPSISEREFIQSILEKFKLSATALNLYLECPYEFKLAVLFKIPQAKPAYLSFGTAVHKALEFLFGEMKNRAGKAPSLAEVLAQFETALEKEPLTEKEFRARVEHGYEVLTKYYQHYQESFIQPLFVERVFGHGFSHPMLGDIPLSGKIDKIERIAQEKKAVRVIDYKTGRPKTRGEIEGTTQNSNGNYKRQLVFYKLLSQLDRSFSLDVQETVFDFVEPKANGEFVQQRFFIHDQEVETLTSLIIDVMQKIRNQEFPRTTEYKKCSDCVFQHHCWPEGIPRSVARGK